MQIKPDIADFTAITPDAPIRAERHGWRAKCLQRLIRLELPVPVSVALPAQTVRTIAEGAPVDAAGILSLIGADRLVSVRPSPANPDWGGPGSLLNIGMNAARHDDLAQRHGKAAATRLYLGFVQLYATHVARLDPDLFAAAADEADDAALDEALAAALRVYAEQTETPFPQDPAVQLGEVLRSMARAWEGTSARLLRQAKGAPAEAPLGLVVQTMALGIGAAACGSGLVQFVSDTTGAPGVSGRFQPHAHGRPVGEGALFIATDPRGPSLQDRAPEVFAELLRHGQTCRRALREEMQIEFTLQAGELWVLDAVRAPRSSRAAVRIAVALAEDGVITPEEALLRIPPRSLAELLHPQVDPRVPRTVIARGLGASPGAARGRIVFTSTAAQASAARDEPCILVRRETTPEDIRGMHAASAVLTERGGMTSHAAVIGRGLGLPCVVGAGGIRIDAREGLLVAPNGERLHEGDVITVDGTRGEVLTGDVTLIDAALDETFRTLQGWAAAASDIDIRANADTPADARIARSFDARGIGLCRTEHMFFEDNRLTLMREMIFADSDLERRAALDRLLPMQRADFIALFDIMQGLPVCIRLFDPPLHEFLPHGREGLHRLADALDKPVSEIIRRAEALAEFNPMLGLRGVRLGITVPEIYDMQARAIFEATVAASHNGASVVPEIMVPLVSARREVQLVKSRIDAVAMAVRTATGVPFTYRLGVMVETPRAALRAGEIAQFADFLSFGTNDLTQMTYGLSRDDAGRFMSSYVQQGVFAEDPFQTLDTDGVGELLLLGAERGRAMRPGITLAMCGEHGGNPESIEFCRRAGFDYVSCSSFRVPVARLAAAQLALADRGVGRSDPAS